MAGAADPITAGAAVGGQVLGDILGYNAQKEALAKAQHNTDVYSKAGIDAILGLLQQANAKQAPFAGLAPDLLKQALGIAYRGGHTRTGAQAPDLASILLSKLSSGGTNPLSSIGTQIGLDTSAPDFPSLGKPSFTVSDTLSKFIPGHPGGNNNDKVAASNGINALSDWTWKNLYPAVQAGQIAPEAAYQQFMTNWNGWQSSLDQVNPDIKASSISSQTPYFQKPLDLNWWKSVAPQLAAPVAPNGGSNAA